MKEEEQLSVEMGQGERGTRPRWLCGGDGTIRYFDALQMATTFFSPPPPGGRERRAASLARFPRPETRDSTLNDANIHPIRGGCRYLITSY